MAFIDKILARRAFPLPHFEPVPLEFEPQRRGDVRPPVPTAGEFCESIERHLRRGKPDESGTDAVIELRDALFELRRSLGQVIQRR